MDAKEKKDRADQTARRVYDILKNHDQEMSTIEAQIDAERAALEEDLEAIRARAYPRGVRYDTPRVQSSPDPDGLLIKVADAIQRRTARTKRATDALEERQRQIENVHEAILTMDAKSKIILLTLYHWRFADVEKPVPPFKKERWRAVMCCETGEIFRSACAAARSMGFSASAVWSALKRGGTSGGYHWKYVDSGDADETTA